MNCSLFIQTARLILRPAEFQDAADLHALWTARDIRYYFWDGQLISRSDVCTEVELSTSTFNESGFGQAYAKSGYAQDKIDQLCRTDGISVQLCPLKQMTFALQNPFQFIQNQKSNTIKLYPGNNSLYISRAWWQYLFD